MALVKTSKIGGNGKPQTRLAPPIKLPPKTQTARRAAKPTCQGRGADRRRDRGVGSRRYASRERRDGIAQRHGANRGWALPRHPAPAWHSMRQSKTVAGQSYRRP